MKCHRKISDQSKKLSKSEKLHYWLSKLLTDASADWEPSGWYKQMYSDWLSPCGVQFPFSAAISNYFLIMVYGLPSVLPSVMIF